MLGKNYEYEQKIARLAEREKELKCLYRVEALLNQDPEPQELYFSLLDKIPNGWQFPPVCKVKIFIEGEEYKEPGWKETPWKQKAQIVADEHIYGRIEVYYTELKKMRGSSPFLPEEQKLLNAIAQRIAHHLFRKKLENSLQAIEQTSRRKDLSEFDILESSHDVHWQWRLHMMEAMMERLKPEVYSGIRCIYLIGSVKEATAGPASDIDLLVHTSADDAPSSEFFNQVEGWSDCLAEVNFSRTGFLTDGLIDLHIVTDQEVQQKSSYGVLIATGNVKSLKKLI